MPCCPAAHRHTSHRPRARASVAGSTSRARAPDPLAVGHCLLSGRRARSPHAVRPTERSAPSSPGTRRAWWACGAARTRCPDRRPRRGSVASPGVDESACGRWTCSAFPLMRCATESSPIVCGLPGRTSSCRPAMRRSMNRVRHLPTVVLVGSRRSTVGLLASPSACSEQLGPDYATQQAASDCGHRTGAANAAHPTAATPPSVCPFSSQHLRAQDAARARTMIACHFPDAMPAAALSAAPRRAAARCPPAAPRTARRPAPATRRSPAPAPAPAALC